MNDLSTPKPKIEKKPVVPPSPYEVWQASEGVPAINGLIVPDIRGDLPMEMWERKGVKGAFVDLLGGHGSMDAYIIEIPPGGQTKPEKYMFEEEIVVLSGRGATSVWLEDDKKQTFEWQEGSLFSPPLNSWRQHFNGNADEPVRLLAVSTAPVMFNLMRSPDFIFNCDHMFKERFNGEEDYFSGKGKALPDTMWRSNLVSDIATFTLQEFVYRTGTGVWFDMSNNTIQSHIAQFPVGTYKPAHRHGPGAHILILSGQGFSLMWKEGEKKKEKLDWGPGSLFSPPDMWFHQHFNSGAEPVRYFAVHYGYWRVVTEDLGPESQHVEMGNQISFEDEDEDVLETFAAELKKSGLSPRPLQEWHR